MTSCKLTAISLALLVFTPAFAQTANDPFPEPIKADVDIITVGFEEFATIPDFGKELPRLMNLVDEPGTGRLFVNDMWGVLYSVSYDGK